MTDKQLEQLADAYIGASRDAIVSDIAALVAARSVEGPAEPGAPYGRGPRSALDTALGIAKKLGLATRDGDGHVGWAEVPGSRDGYIATINHVDVVPEGEGWDGEPYTLREKDGWLLGRGVADNKGPGVLCLYAARFFAQNGIPLRYGLRVLLGTNEETGMADVAYYLEHQPQPLFCFSPDAGFPVCHGEKGLFAGRFLSPPLAGSLAEVKGGIASNVIPDKAECLIRAAAPPPPAGRVTAEPAGGGMYRLTARGIGGHAASPDGTLNAIGLLVAYLLEHGLCSEEENTFLRLLQRLHTATDGSGLGIACTDDKFTPLTCIGGEIQLFGGRLSQSVNIRFPTSTTAQKLEALLQKAAAEHGAGFETDQAMPPFYIPANTPAIAALAGAYTRVTGRDEKPFTIGGGTYARHFKNAASVGPFVDNGPRPPFAGPEHGANEGADLEGLMQALKIFILAIWRLQQVDF